MASKRPVYATLVGDMCSADGHTVQGNAPVLLLCQILMQAGYDPERPLMAFRGTELAMKIDSLGFGAYHSVNRMRWSEIKAARKADRADRS